MSTGIALGLMEWWLHQYRQRISYDFVRHRQPLAASREECRLVPINSRYMMTLIVNNGRPTPSKVREAQQRLLHCRAE